MRRLAFPLLVIGLAAGLFTMGSGAFFSDVESDTGNTITAGTLDLSDPNEESATTSCTQENLIAPTVPTPVVVFDDDFDYCESSVTNIGSLAGDLWLRIDVNGTSCMSNGGSGEDCDELADLNAELAVEDCSEPVGGGAALAGGPPNPCSPVTNADSLSMPCTLVATLPAAGTYGVRFSLNDSGVTNASQGDSIEFNFYYELVQPGQTPSDDCGGPPNNEV